MPSPAIKPARIGDIGWDYGIKCQALYLDLQQRLGQNEFVYLGNGIQGATLCTA